MDVFNKSLLFLALVSRSLLRVVFANCDLNLAIFGFVLVRSLLPRSSMG